MSPKVRIAATRRFPVSGERAGAPLGAISQATSGQAPSFAPIPEKRVRREFLSRTIESSQSPADGSMRLSSPVRSATAPTPAAAAASASGRQARVASPSRHEATSVHLIVALSARALAQMARRAAVPVVTLDAFADDDAADVALDAQRAAMSSDMRFEPEPLLESVKRLARHFGTTATVLGSGFESTPELIDAIERITPVAGNRAATVRMLKDPQALATLLGRLSIPHPETRTALPEDRRGWLVKRRGRAGGWHVRRAEEAIALEPEDYVQRRVDGELVSIVFLADGRQAHLVGANRFWTGMPGPSTPEPAADGDMPSASRSPYAFSGAVSVAPASVAPLEEMHDAIAALVRATGLVGLNGIDCIVAPAANDAICAGATSDRGTTTSWWLLEVNPRPTSTAELHDRGWPRGLFGAHLLACSGTLGDGRLVPPTLRAGLQVVYADQAVRVPQHLVWPEWVTDRPRAGAAIAQGDPLCTVHARAADEASVRLTLAARAERVGHLLAPLAA